MAKTKDLLREGFLDYAFNQNVVSPKAVKLTTTDLSVITTVYGHLYKLGNLYELLFETDPQRIDTPAGQINTKDIAAFTWMRYLLPPSAYWKVDGGKPAYRETAYCGGTPLALLGARMVHNVAYNSWHQTILDKEDIEQVFRVDIFLGSNLASTYIDQEDGQLKWHKKDGLIKFLGTSDTLFQAGEIREIRELSGHPITSYRTRDIAQDVRNIEYYNDANQYLRHLIRQTWIYYGKHRSTNMILHWNDWDRVPKDIDQLSVALESYSPQGTSAPTGWAGLMRGDFKVETEENS